MNEQTIFTAALELETSQRPAFLDEACGNSPELRQRVEKLLQLNAGAGKFMEQPAAVAVVTIDQPTERPGTQIGPYKLLQQIGEGGMGVVYMAEQHEPVKRRVALKIIKPGMDTRQVIARFEAERQALSLMEHPNIAKVLDAGTTDSGRPYFVMELVKGQPITQYCDEKHLTPRQRLELFLPVCQAIQHAHQKGIIHRDIKPTNILVAEYDQQPVPKVIDFGVAKATSQTLTEKTMFTGLGQIVGTLEYMSPEQAKVNQLDIDTRSDIYSLGVLLYELLTGSTPFDKQRLRSAAFDEMLRIIREEEPPKPSTRLSESTNSLPSISAQRHIEPAKLTKLVRGELDWIVMKALEKDRNRRYETANGFAADVQRYLADEPVQACPPSAFYRLRKFARRNKAALGVAGMVLFFLVLLGSGAGWAVRDRSSREAEAAGQRTERQAKVAGQVESIFAEVDRLEKEQKWPEALAAARRAEAATSGGEANAETAERVRQRLKDLEFIDGLEQIRMERMTMVEGKFDNAGADQKYALTFLDYVGDILTLPAETSIDRLKARPALAIPLAAALDDWVHARSRYAVDWKRLVAVARGIDPEPLRDRLRSTWGRPASETQDELRRLAESIDIQAQHPATLVSLARTLRRVGKSDSEIRLLRDAQNVYRGDFWLNYELGFVLNEQKDHEGRVRFYTAAVAIRPNSAIAHTGLGLALNKQGEADEAIICHRKAIEIDPKFTMAYNNLGLALRDQKKLPEAVAAFHKAIEIDPAYAGAYSNLGLALRDQKKLPEAIVAYHKAIELDPKSGTYSNLGLALRDQKKLPEAIDAYRKAIEIDPKCSAAHHNLGGLLLEDLKDYGKAVESFRKAIAIDSGYAAAYHGLGTALRYHKKLPDAITAYHKAIELDPKNATARSDLGALLSAELNDHDKAIECFRKAVEIDPKHEGARGNLANALGRKGWELVNHADPKLREPKRAIEAIQEAVELAPQSTMAWQLLGWVQYRTGNWQASIEALEKSCQLQKGSAGDAGQWIVLALAHARLAAQEELPAEERARHQGEARRWYEQADKIIALRWQVRPVNTLPQAVWDFHAEATELLKK